MDATSAARAALASLYAPGAAAAAVKEANLFLVGLQESSDGWNVGAALFSPAEPEPVAHYGAHVLLHKARRALRELTDGNDISLAHSNVASFVSLLCSRGPSSTRLVRGKAAAALASVLVRAAAVDGTINPLRALQDSVSSAGASSHGDALLSFLLATLGALPDELSRAAFAVNARSRARGALRDCATQAYEFVVQNAFASSSDAVLIRDGFEMIRSWISHDFLQLTVDVVRFAGAAVESESRAPEAARAAAAFLADTLPGCGDDVAEAAAIGASAVLRAGPDSEAATIFAVAAAEEIESSPSSSGALLAAVTPLLPRVAETPALTTALLRIAKADKGSLHPSARSSWPVALKALLSGLELSEYAGSFDEEAWATESDFLLLATCGSDDDDSRALRADVANIASDLAAADPAVCAVLLQDFHTMRAVEAEVVIFFLLAATARVIPRMVASLQPLDEVLAQCLSFSASHAMNSGSRFVRSAIGGSVALLAAHGGQCTGTGPFLVSRAAAVALLTMAGSSDPGLAALGRVAPLDPYSFSAVNPLCGSPSLWIPQRRWAAFRAAGALATVSTSGIEQSLRVAATLERSATLAALAALAEGARDAVETLIEIRHKQSGPRAVSSELLGDAAAECGAGGASTLLAQMLRLEAVGSIVSALADGAAGDAESFGRAIAAAMVVTPLKERRALAQSLDALVPALVAAATGAGVPAAIHALAELSFDTPRAVQGLTEAASAAASAKWDEPGAAAAEGLQAVAVRSPRSLLCVAPLRALAAVVRSAGPLSRRAGLATISAICVSKANDLQPHLDEWLNRDGGEVIDAIGDTVSSDPPQACVSAASAVLASLVPRAPEIAARAFAASVRARATATVVEAGGEERVAVLTAQLASTPRRLRSYLTDLARMCGGRAAADVLVAYEM